MFTLLLFLSIWQIVHCSCPTGFELVRDGECRGKYLSYGTYLDTSSGVAISKCKDINGHPVIIHNQEQQSYWTNLKEANGSAPMWKRPIGLTCSSKTKQWEWSDGSSVDFTPMIFDSRLHDECSTACSWLINNAGEWSFYCNEEHEYFTADILCSTQLQQPTGDGCQSFDDDSEDGMCYQVYTAAKNWQDDQNYCRNMGANSVSIHNLQENSFIRRLAVSTGAVDGIFLGAKRSSSGNKFAWSDGSAWDYEYFSPGFPVASHGDCLAMDTLTPSGQWMNMDCSSKLGVACGRKADQRHECTAGPWKEGEVIYSPGYPYEASIPCDYYLQVASGRKVQVEVLLLEANTCCDRLILTDDVLGGNIVANLTGEISDKTYTTKSSNLMRVSWQPDGGVNVRGFMMTYRAV